MATRRIFGGLELVD